MADLGAVAIHYLHDPVPQDLFQKNNNHFVSEPSFTHLALPLVPGVAEEISKAIHEAGCIAMGCGGKDAPGGGVASPAEGRQRVVEGQA